MAQYFPWFGNCECSDPGCPVHRGLPTCPHRATDRVFRVDMADKSGTLMCPGCTEDALDAEVFRQDDEA